MRVDTADATHWVDTGFIVFNDRNYPRFERLLERLGVATQPSDMSFAVTDGGGDFEYASASPNGLFASAPHLVSPRSTACWPTSCASSARRASCSRRRGRARRSASSSTSGASRARSSSASSCPQAAAVWSADPRQMWTFPARFLVEFFDNHGMLGLRGRPQWRTVTGGSQRYVEALDAPFADRIRLSHAGARDRPLRDRVEVTPRGGEPERFDESSSPPTPTRRCMLADPTRREREVLGAIRYQPNEAVLHTDTGLLPRRRRAWASWNYHLLDAPAGRPTVTYHMNRLQSLEAAEGSSA